MNFFNDPASPRCKAYLRLFVDWIKLDGELMVRCSRQRVTAASIPTLSLFALAVVAIVLVLSGVCIGKPS